MRVYILFSDDPIFKPRLLHDILVHDNFQCCGVGEVLSPKRGGIYRKLTYNMRFWGFLPLLYIAVEHYLRKTISSSSLVSASINGTLSMEKICIAFRIPFQKVPNVNEPSFLKYLEALQPDLILSFQHQIFRERILSIPTIACVNCHPALLPSYRGVKPIFWAMINREEHFGVTLHTMLPAIDTGRLVSQIKVPLNLQNTMFQNYKVAYALSAQAITQGINCIKKVGNVLALPIIPECNAYYHEPSISDIKRFKQSGLKVF